MGNIKNIDVIIPFFNDTENLTEGLNNLGIRTVSEFLFSTLLPGLNNVTLRIRYYSFYCWIISKFYEGREELRPNDFNIYIRRAEYLLALIHAKAGQTLGVPGTDFASVVISNDSRGPYTISSGADKEKNDRSYWSYSGGIFRQYYSASLENLRLVAPLVANGEDLNITQDLNNGMVSGAELSKVFEEHIGKEASSHFIECLEKNVATNEDLDAMFKSFNMRDLKADSHERDKLIKMLIEDDSGPKGKSSYRRDTIKYFLKFVSSNPSKVSEMAFSYWMYENFINGHFNDNTAIGWYAYFLNDEWQYLMTNIFSILLDKLHEHNNWIPINSIVEEVGYFISKKMIESYGDISIRELLDKQLAFDFHDVSLSSGNYYLGLLCLVNINFNKLPFIDPIFHFSGYDFTKFANEVKRSENLDLSISKFAEKLVLKIIYMHYTVSFRKQISTNIASQKFIIDNDSILFVKGYGATHTSPRINTLKGFMEDLDLVSENMLTEKGHKLKEIIDD